MADRARLERLRRRFWSQLGDPLIRGVRGPVQHALNRGRDYRPVFIAGAMGSGTSLVAVQLGQSFDCAGVVYESASEVAARSPLHSPGTEGFASVAAYRDSILPAADWSCERGRQDLLHLYRSTASSRASSDIIIDKGPNTNLVRAGFLARCFPDAHFVLIFRDPVVAIEGFRRKWPPFSRDSLAASIDFYEEVHARFLDDAAAFSERLVAIDYASYVARNAPLLEVLGARLGLRPAQHRRRLRSRGNLPGRGIRNVSDNTIGLVGDADRAAYDRVSSDTIAEINERTAPLYARLREAALD